jgi:hypothetical protein
MSADTLLSAFTDLSHASRIAYVEPIFCTSLAALWAVENPSATAAEIVAYGGEFAQDVHHLIAA